MITAPGVTPTAETVMEATVVLADQVLTHAAATAVVPHIKRHQFTGTCEF